MTTIFPGHYSGRTTHIHILSHSNPTVNANRTLSGGTVSHIGQLFFDQSLITEVSQVAPYNTNTQSLTENSDDNILAGEAGTTDPILNYVLVGDSVSDGIVAWMTVGVDSGVSKDVSVAVAYGASGGVANSNGGGVRGGTGSGGGRPGNGTTGAPSGGNSTNLPGADLTDSDTTTSSPSPSSTVTGGTTASSGLAARFTAAAGLIGAAAMAFAIL